MFFSIEMSSCQEIIKRLHCNIVGVEVGANLNYEQVDALLLNLGERKHLAIVASPQLSVPDIRRYITEYVIKP
jgi:hypothetical protein